MDTELQQGENIEKQFSPSRKSVLILDYITSIIILIIAAALSIGIVGFAEDIPFVGEIMGTTLIFGIGLVLALPSVIKAEIKVRANTYYLTNRRIVKERKFVHFTSKTVKYNRITHISTQKSLTDRIFNTGTIEIKTAGTDEAEMKIKLVKNESEIQQTISRHMNQTGSQTTYSNNQGNNFNNQNNNQQNFNQQSNNNDDLFEEDPFNDQNNF